MQNQDILAHWSAQEETVTTFSLEPLLPFGFQPTTVAFLTTIGLPEQAAPFLSFYHQVPGTAGGLYRVQQAYELDESFAGYIAIGCDCMGNPLVINTQQQDRIEWLDHEDDFASAYVNASLGALASCIVVYEQFIQRVQQEEGGDAYVDARFTDAQFTALEEALRAEDAQAVEHEEEEARFWQVELMGLLANRENNQELNRN